MSFTCDACRRSFRGAPTKTLTGRSLCRDCHAQLLGASAGLVAGGNLTDALATGAAHTALKRNRRPEKS